MTATGGKAALLVLASASRTRARLLAEAGLAFSAVAAVADEAALKESLKREGASAEDVALALARLKARRVAAERPGALVVGCDQLLECEGEWFDKPRDKNAARAQLAQLRGRMHRLATAVVVVKEDRCLWHHVASPRLTMRAFSDAFLANYLERVGEEVCESVGGYRLEGLGAQLFETVEGDYFAILGLPLLPLLAYLRDSGVLNA